MRLVEYPWVVVRLSCRICPRHGRARLARLAERYGAEIELEDMLDRIAWTCPYPRRPEPGRKAAEVPSLLRDLSGRFSMAPQGRRIARAAPACA